MQKELENIIQLNQEVIVSCKLSGLEEMAKLHNDLNTDLYKFLKANFDPNQPRVPAGNPDGGQWTDDLSWIYDEETDSILFSPKLLTTSSDGVRSIAKHEAFESEVYLDQAGLPTIGYGHLIRSGESFSDGISKEDALDLLAKDVRVAESTVQKKVKVKLRQNEFDALVSLTFNIGSGAFSNSTLLRELNKGNFEEAADQFLVWNKVTIDGKLTVSKGLTKRRKEEREVFVYTPD